MLSVNRRYLEFDKVCVDLRHVTFSADGQNDTEYIIFININRAMFTNFKIYCDLSIESLAEFIYDNVVCTVEGNYVRPSVPLSECVQYNEYDLNKSLIIELHEKAKIIVAKTIYHDETYHERVTGYVDFENRHNKNYVPPPTSEVRNKLDREYEIKLLEFT
ncbi:se90 [Alphabaculovirus alterspexiguae]|uniref:Se90 n=1 Tax=Spodoptera exigua multiple nucleopolyhedrovirus TaxID=10454 RepID=A0A3G2JU30_9ABAC|nr:se90 [Spodoptera exigua multiple nucleopolyhedrovirus]AYN45050.1 se90 [Spodoptera exigua multiple nucleopolyhedrovirus]